jgi:hypothetical protein
MPCGYLRERVRMRGNLKENSFLILLTPTLSATAPALPYYLHPCRHPAGEGAIFLDLTALGNYHVMRCFALY